MGARNAILSDPTAHALTSGDLEALFLPGRGMLGASLRHRGDELLRRIEDLDATAARGSTAGIPLLHPWANRLAAPRYRAAGRSVELDPASPLLHLDEHGLPIHGVPWAMLAWEVVAATRDSLQARLDWNRADLLAIFPFPHRIEIAATLRPEGLTLETTLRAPAEGSGESGAATLPVPVSFGFHPYLGLPGLAREEWRVTLPPMQSLVLDAQGIPTGAAEPFPGLDAALAERSLDDGFALLGDTTSFSLSGAKRRLSVDLLAGYRYAQVFAPRDKDYIALEPMTAPTSALTSGRGLGLVAAGEQVRATFRIRVEAD